MDALTSFQVGLVGAGNISEFHVRALRRLPNVTIAGIVDVDQDRARALAERFGIPGSYGSLAEMTRRAIDAVHVLTPPHTHAALALEALERGCHVLVEKPLATSVADCDALEAAAREMGRTVCVNHSLLFDAFIARARHLVESGAIGEVVAADYLRSSEYPPYPGGPLPPQYRDGGYPFRDLGVHALYLMEAFLGPITDARSTFRSRGGDPNLRFDEWRTLVTCERGTGNVQLSWNVRPLHHLLVLQGTRGVMRVDLISMTVTLRRPWPMPKALERATNGLLDGLQTCAQVPANAVRFARGRILPYHGLQMLVAEFYRRLASGEHTPVSVADARRVIDWTERIAAEADEAKARASATLPEKLQADVLVTGAGGFLGGHLVRRLLDEGQRVRVFVRRQPTAAWRGDPRVEVVLGDLGDPEAVERAVRGVRLVYHVGAAMSGSPADFERGSVAGTRHVVDSVLRQPDARLVYVSSLSVLHATAGRHGARVTETWPLEPAPDQRGLYSWAKREAEDLVVAAVRERGLRAAILRPGRIFGPGAPLLPPDMKVVGGRLLILGNGHQPLPLVYVSDVVDALLLAVENDAFDGSVFHLVDPDEVTQDELAQTWIRAISPALRITHLPRPVLHGMALGFEALGRALRRTPPLSRYRLDSALAPLSFDCSLAATRLGWTPRVGLRAGLQATLEHLTGALPSTLPTRGSAPEKSAAAA